MYRLARPALRHRHGSSTAAKGLRCVVVSDRGLGVNSGTHTGGVLLQARVPSGTFNLIPAGLAQSKRKHFAARFAEVSVGLLLVALLAAQCKTAYKVMFTLGPCLRQHVCVVVPSQ
jgi:hypothetical protein